MTLSPRWILPLLLVASGCGLTGTPATGARVFYLTRESVPGDKPTTACAPGFHMASRFEIAEPSGLVYDPSRGLGTADAGGGPPSVAATYGAVKPAGWIRTGGGSQYTATGSPMAADTNCARWTTASRDAFGTVAFLGDDFGKPLWSGGPQRCDVASPVWCIEDAQHDLFRSRPRREAP